MGGGRHFLDDGGRLGSNHGDKDSNDSGFDEHIIKFI
jgi:hypothetical protein